MLTDNLESILKQQKENVVQLEKEVKSLADSDLTKENTQLKNEIATVKAEYEKVKLELKTTKDENTSIKNALYEQIYSEKMNILNLSAKKLDIYFRSSREHGMNSLNKFEKDVKARIDQINKELQKNQIDLRDGIYESLNELTVTLNQKVKQVKDRYAKANNMLSAEAKSGLNALKNEELTPEQIKAVTKKNNLESFIGQSIINKIGIFLVVIGVILASQYTYRQLNDLFKCISMFALGGVMIGVGELLNRKKSNAFSIGITSGGVAILYVAMSVSYFILNVLSVYPAIIICLLVTALSFSLSIRYNSQTIASFALIGGYLPLLSINTNMVMICGAMLYFTALNLFALCIAFKKKWQVASFIGLVLNLIGNIYIIGAVMIETTQSNFVVQGILLSYTILTFLMYTAIPIIATFKSSKIFKTADIVFLAINTFAGLSIIYSLFYTFGLKQFNGLLSMLFAGIYWFVGRIIKRNFENDKHGATLFYCTAVTFLVLTVPFQFDTVWISLGWLIEGVVLTVYGIVKKKNGFKTSGFVINALCLDAFLLLDVTINMDWLFPYKYLAMTLGSLIILAAYIYTGQNQSSHQKAYKYITIINLWFYAIYTSHKLTDILIQALPHSSHACECFGFTVLITETFFMAYALVRLKWIADSGTKVISKILQCIIAFMTVFLVNFNCIYDTGYLPFSMFMVGIIVLLVANAFAVFAMNDFLKSYVLEEKLSAERYTLLVSSFSVILLTQLITVQAGLSFSNILISIIYAMTALLWIIVGFLKKYSLLRSYGLGLAVSSVVKLFIVDLFFLTAGYKIIAYFVLGISLIAISYVYQRFSKRLEIEDIIQKTD